MWIVTKIRFAYALNNIIFLIGLQKSWNMFGISWMYHVAGELGVRVDVPFKDLTEKEKDIVYNGPSVKRYINIPSKNGKLFENGGLPR